MDCKMMETEEPPISHLHAIHGETVVIVLPISDENAVQSVTATYLQWGWMGDTDTEQE